MFVIFNEKLYIYTFLVKCVVKQQTYRFQREKLGTHGKVPGIYTNIYYHLYIYIYWVIQWFYGAFWCNALRTTARVPSQGYPKFPFDCYIHLYMRQPACGIKLFHSLTNIHPNIHRKRIMDFTGEGQLLAGGPISLMG